MANGVQLFTAFLFVQLFYAFAVTLIVPAIPMAMDNQLVMFTNSDMVIEYTTIANTMEGNISDQTNIPVLDFGALVFYSTNLLLNLMVNFFTAVPQMLSVLLSAVFIFFPVSYTMQTNIKVIFTIILTIIYFLSIFFMITNLRSGGSSGIL